MSKDYTSISMHGLRRFTFKQLSKISDDNKRVLNICIDISSFNESDMFYLSPAMVHYHSHGKPVDPHIRAFVIAPEDFRRLGLQDLTFGQWEEGEEVQKETIKFSEKVRRDFRKKELIKKSA